MKRIMISLLVLPIILLSACGEPPTVQSSFSASFSAEHDGTAYAGTVTRDGSAVTVALDEPYTVSGLAFCWEDSALSVRYMGHSAQANADYLPADSLPAALHNCLAYLPQAVYTDTDSGGDHFTLPTPYGDAALTAKNGLPTSLTDPNSEAVFHFE